jgi:hypothetical protein
VVTAAIAAATELPQRPGFARLASLVR